LRPTQPCRQGWVPTWRLSFAERLELQRPCSRKLDRTLHRDAGILRAISTTTIDSDMLIASPFSSRTVASSGSRR
jgi:hypothetical protein